MILTGVGVYSYNTTDAEASALRSRVLQIVMNHDWALQMHGFYADTKTKTMRFDVVLSFEIPQKEAMETLYGEISSAFPDYKAQIIPDVDITD